MSREILAEGKYRRFVRVNGWEFTERIHCNKVVVMVALSDHKELIIVEQLRVPVGKSVIEFPAGLVNDKDDNQHESLEETARRELVEETGYTAQTLQLIRVGPASAALANDTLHVFLATGLKKIGPGGGDETENITIHEIPLSQVDEWLDIQSKQGKLIDMKVFAGLYYLKKQGFF